LQPRAAPRADAGLPPTAGAGYTLRPSPCGAVMRAVLDLLLLVLDLYTYVIIAVAIMSWLIAFNVINIYNDLVRSIWNFLNALTEPVLRPIRRLLPNLGGLDISPIIVLLIIFFIERVIQYYLYPALIRY
jgi:YggT family protein